MASFNTRLGGFLAGIGRPIAKHFIAGAALGYGHTDLSVHDGQSGSLDAPRLMLYGSYTLGPWAVDATAGYAHDFIDATRRIAALGETASFSHGANEATGVVEASRRFALGGITVLPAAGLEYVHLFARSFTESGASVFDLAVSGRNADSLCLFIGASAAKAFTTVSGLRLVPEGDISYSHELMNTPPSLVQVDGGSFTVDGLTPSRNQLGLGLGGGVTAKMNKRLAFYADYHAVLPTGNLFQQTVEAGLTYLF